MKKQIARFSQWIFGWKSEVIDLDKVRKSVMIAAPHTSNWDLIHMVSIFWRHDINVKFFIKNSYTKGIHGFIFKGLGGIGIDRSQKNNVVETAAKMFEKGDLIVIVPPEGTRKRVERWKTGFYQIAKHAKVPVSFGFLDYPNKTGGVGGVIDLTDSMENDMKKIEDFYKTKTGKFPEMYNEKIY